jgi:hypothetical protein
MSEKLLGDHLEDMTGRLCTALKGEARAKAVLSQSHDLLTSLGVPRTTMPKSEGKTRGLMDHFTGSPPRTLSLTERIMLGVDPRPPEFLEPAGA